ncbi:MAG: hypothetical protein ACO225_14855 [Ilumatobacteraceae bacterium]
MDQNEPQPRREYRRPAAPQVVATVPEATSSYYGSGQDFLGYASVGIAG